MQLQLEEEERRLERKHLRGNEGVGTLWNNRSFSLKCFMSREARRRCCCCDDDDNAKYELVWVMRSLLSLVNCQTMEVERKAVPCHTSAASLALELIISDVWEAVSTPCSAAQDWFQTTIITSKLDICIFAFLLGWKTACQHNGTRFFCVPLRQI